MPKYPVPVVLLGRLAVAKSHQSMGPGSILLTDSLQRVLQASQVMAVYAMDDRAAECYQRFGFIPVPSHALKIL